MTATTAQDIFDTVARHLIKQGRRSMRDTGIGSPQCAYRGEGGTKCAVGCLISDDEYTPSMEGVNLYSLLFRGWLPDSLVPLEHLLADLQIDHDTTPDGEDFVGKITQRLRQTAQAYKLSTAALGAALAEVNSCEK